jgi:hypothetical protein
MMILRSRRWLLATATFSLVLAACTGPADRPGSGAGTAGSVAGSGSAVASGRQGLSAVRHVWVIELENRGYAQSFGTPSADPYLARTLPRMGVLLENYYGMAAPAYRDSGLIVVTFDEGSDAAACCGETSGLSPDHPNVPEPGKTGPGGGRIGAVLLSR